MKNPNSDPKFFHPGDIFITLDWFYAGYMCNVLSTERIEKGSIMFYISFDRSREFDAFIFYECSSGQLVSIGTFTASQFIEKMTVS